MTFELDRTAAVTHQVDGVYAAHLDAGWVVGGGVNGGYVLAVAAAAIRAELADAGHTDPVSTSGYYLSPSVPGPAIVRTRVLRRGGRRSTVAATLSQLHEGVEVDRVTVLAVVGTVDAGGAPAGDPAVEALRRELPPVALPPIEECVRTADAPDDVRRTAPLLQRLDLRLDPACAGWAVGRPSGAGVVQGWLRLADHRPPDPWSLLVVVDALPPVSFDLGLPGWAPTVELTVHVRQRPVDGWLRVRHATRTVAGGSFEEDCEVWDEAGHLVAQSRQLALLPRASKVPS